MDKKFNFFISIFISIFIYLLLILSFFLYIKKENIEKFSAQSESLAIELDFVVEQNEVLEKVEENSVASIESDVVQEEQKVNAVKQDVNTQSLFGNFNSKSEKISKKEVLQENVSSLNSRFQSKITSKENERKSFELSKLIDVKQATIVTKNQSSSSDDGKYDEYYSKINKYILTRWYNFPFMTDIRYIVTANITISGDGSFDFVIVKNSGNSRIDEAIKEFLMQQRLVKYPVSPDKLSKTIKINFKPNFE